MWSITLGFLLKSESFSTAVSLFPCGFSLFSKFVFMNLGLVDKVVYVCMYVCMVLCTPVLKCYDEEGLRSSAL